MDAALTEISYDSTRVNTLFSLICGISTFAFVSYFPSVDSA